MEQARAKLQQHSAAPQPSANGGGAPVTVGAAVAAPQPIAHGGGALVTESDGHDDPRWEEHALISELVAEIRQTPDGAALLGDLTEGGDIVPPPATRQRTEEPPFDVLSLFASPVLADAPAAVPADGYRGLGGADAEPQQWQSMGASDQEPAPAFRSLGADDEPVLRSAAAAQAVQEAQEAQPGYLENYAREDYLRFLAQVRLGLGLGFLVSPSPHPHPHPHPNTKSGPSGRRRPTSPPPVSAECGEHGWGEHG